MNDVNFMQFEARVKKMVLGLMERPVGNMNKFNDILMASDVLTKRNTRRINELENIMHKYSNAVSVVDSFE
jgi:hypothetical protein